MAKIYINENDIKELIMNKTGSIRFEKKYIKIHDYLIQINLLPNVLCKMIIDYINYNYIVELYYSDDKIIRKGLFITQITNSLTNEQLINLYRMCTIFKINNTIFVYSEKNTFTTYNDQEEYKINNINHISMYPQSNFFNYYMKKYYNKKNYICKNEQYNSDKIKITNHKELTNVIIIFKILFRMYSKINLSTCHLKS